MRSFSYDALPGRVVFAPGAFDRAADELSRLGVGHALLIADRSGAVWADRLRASLGAAIAATIDDVVPHVPIERAEAARELARTVGADSVITLGGGSATGLGKAVALELPLPILAIPTTYAGSEMTPIWGLTTSARKETGRDPRVLPRMRHLRPAADAVVAAVDRRARRASTPWPTAPRRSTRTAPTR